MLFRGYRAFVEAAIRARWVSIAVVLGVFAVSLWGFQFVENQFFPPSTRPQFLVEIQFREGTHVRVTEEKVREIEEYLWGYEGIEHIASSVGEATRGFC